MKNFKRNILVFGGAGIIIGVGIWNHLVIHPSLLEEIILASLGAILFTIGLFTND